MLEGMKVIFRVGLALLAQQQEALPTATQTAKPTCVLQRNPTGARPPSQVLVKLPFEKLVAALKKNPDPGKARVARPVALRFYMHVTPACRSRSRRRPRTRFWPPR